jgi:hypothetical protein
VGKAAVPSVEQVGFLGTGAALGLFLALGWQVSGHPWWVLLMQLLCAFGPGGARVVADLHSGRSAVQTARRSTLSAPAKVGLVLLMIAITLAVTWAGHMDPADLAYVPVLLPSLLAALFLGVGYAALAIVLTTIAADHLFSGPVESFSITRFADVMGLSVFAGLGAGLAWLAYQFVPPDEDAAA